MFHPHDIARNVFDDRRVRYERAAAGRRLLSTLRRRSNRSTTAEQAGAARQPITLGRTPSVVERRAA